MSILDLIQPITLLRGSHQNAGQTGQGCLMNVVSYLNGDRKITDRPPCACPVIARIAICANDIFTDEDRQLLLRFIPRISGSRTADKAELVQRAQACAKFAERVAVAAAYAANVAAYANDATYYAAGAAGVAGAVRAADAAGAAAYANDAPYAFIRDALIDLLDELCPPAADESPVLIERARQYVALAGAK